MTNPIYDCHYIVAKKPQALIDYLKIAFYANELERTTIRNCILQIGVIRASW